MKKLFVALLMGLVLCPLQMDAKLYKVRHTIENPNPPVKSPTICSIEVDVDYETGYLCISPDSNVTGLQITLVSNGVTYLNTTVSLSAGQSYTDCLDYLGVGTYLLTLSTVDGVIEQYEITVEDDD